MTILDNLRAFLGRDAAKHPIPVMDGALAPNDILDDSAPLGPPIPGIDDFTPAADGQEGLFVTAGEVLLHCTGADFGKRRVLCRFGGAAGPVASSADGRLLVGVSGRGLAIVERGGAVRYLDAADGVPIRCLTALTVLPDGTVLACEGSTRNPHDHWSRDLIEDNAAGRILAITPGLQEAKVMLDGLRYPSGIALSADGTQVWFTESWGHTISTVPARGTARPQRIVRNMPGYPGRLSAAADGGFWLAVFAARTHLVDFVIKETRFKQEMMDTVDPALWIAPSLCWKNHYHDPLQGGQIKKLGIYKPWAPPRSYGLAAHLDPNGEFDESLHSRVGGLYHGITAVREVAGHLLLASKGNGVLLRRPIEGPRR